MRLYKLNSISALFILYKPLGNLLFQSLVHRTLKHLQPVLYFPLRVDVGFVYLKDLLLRRLYRLNVPGIFLEVNSGDAFEAFPYISLNSFNVICLRQYLNQFIVG